MTIESLSLIDEVTASTYFAISVSGQDYRVSAAELLAYIQDGATESDDKVSQYAAPSATGFSVSITDGPDSVWLILTPVAGYAAGTIVLPAVGNCLDHQEVLVNCTQSVTTLTIDDNGATVTGAPTTLAANAYFRLRFDAVTDTWYRVG